MPTGTPGVSHLRRVVWAMIGVALAAAHANLAGFRVLTSRIAISAIGRQQHSRRSHTEHGTQCMSSLSVQSLPSNLAFMTLQSLLIQRRHMRQQITTAPNFAFPSFSGHSKFHSTTMLKMARKRNGGKSKKVRLGVRNKVDEDGYMPSSTFVDEDPNGVLENSGENAKPEFAATFASDYHAPVMPTECIDALLKQGEWGDILRVRKERWRKKRSIIEAKRRKAGYCSEESGDGHTHDATGEGPKPMSSSPASKRSEKKQYPRIFIDGTLGGGGHSHALLEQLIPGDVLVGCDIDPEALATASIRLAEYLGTCEYIFDKIESVEQLKCDWKRERPMFIPVQSNFRNLVSVLSKVRHPLTGRLLLGDRVQNTDKCTVGCKDGQIEFPGGVNGMILDLGVSSHQIDTSDRGFAFMKEGPLDMRMSGKSRTGTLTAADVCNEFDEAALINILRTYGDEPRARRITSAIVASRPLHTTTDLVHAINSVTPTFARQKRAGLIATCARVFQALRIVVNEEDGALQEVLESVAPWALSRSYSHHLSEVERSCADMMDDGILVVLSYHSMEDKMVKRVIRDGKVDLFHKRPHKGTGGALEHDLFGNVINDDVTSNCVPFDPLAKPRKATNEEVSVNSRSRSATLRVAVRI